MLLGQKSIIYRLSNRLKSNRENLGTLMGRLPQSLSSMMALHRLFPLRQRYIMTRQNKVRLRYVASTLAMFGTVGLLAAAQTSNAFITTSAKFDQLANAISIPPIDFGTDREDGIAKEVALLNVIPELPKGPLEQVVKVKSGETMAGVLEKSGVDSKSAYEIVKAMSAHYDPRKVQAGQEIALKFDKSGDPSTFSEMTMKIDPIKEVVVSKGDDASFVGAVLEKEVKEHTYAKMARIENSVYGSAARAGIPAPVIAEVIKIYSWNVDFQRDIQPDDKIEVLYSAFETDDGDFAKFGDVQYAALTVGGKTIPIYRFERDGDIDYYDDKGQSIRATLMRTPVDGARISSGFGMRKHPVLGYSKMHKGMDFAAPTGTPIYAAGDATVEYSGRFSSYGNYVRLRHNGSLKTAYAHMHHIAKGVKVGSRVRQGEVIGYVGTTGRSTGPHLHYEVMVNNTQVNPKSVDLPTGEQLTGKNLDKFKDVVRNLHKQYVAMVDGTDFAQNASSNSVQ